MSHLLTLVTTIFAVALFSGCTGPGRTASTESGKQAPDFALQDHAGHLLHLSDYRGKVVALNFWATWCYPCRNEMPWLDSLKRTYQDRGFVVIGISKDEKGWQAVSPFLAEIDISYQVVIGTEQVAQLYGGAEPVPTTLLIGRDGRIDAVYAGIVNRKDFEGRIERLLRGPTSVK